MQRLWHGPGGGSRYIWPGRIGAGHIRAPGFFWCLLCPQRLRPDRLPDRPGYGRSSRGMLGIGLVEVPPVPYRDPAAAILRNPEVAESKRFCGKCGQPVGRSRDGRPARAEGFCRHCGTAYSFEPKLAPNDLVAGQYEVLGCLAHGGLGWIYLARDRNVSDRWVVLKGLLNTGDADAMAAAAAERQFLATVEHRNIIKIYDFVQHPDPRTGAPVGYIVMEYVGGQSLKELMLARRRPDGRADPLPLGQAIAYMLEVLRAFGYLHDHDLLYCDFKPDNVIQSEELLKLIDLGGVRQIDDDESPIYGTVGYQAPEIATDGPSVSSDLYTVARTLAVLTFDFTGYTSTYKERLPERDQVPLLARHESYDRFLRRAADTDPARRFGSAAEMAQQLTGVLREVLALADGTPRPAASALFGPEVRAVGADLTVRRDGEAVVALARPDPAPAAMALPVPLADGADPSAGFLAGLSGTAPAEVVAALAAAPVNSTEVQLRLARARIELGLYEGASQLLDDLTRRAGAGPPEGTLDPSASGPVPTSGEPDWRVDWLRGLAHLARGRPDAALAVFDDLYRLLPGEAAPKLAVAFSAEQAGDPAAAARCYELVWGTDHGYVSAAFGLARARLAQGARTGAATVLDSVPATSSYHISAQVASVAARDPRPGGRRVRSRGRDRGRLATGKPRARSTAPRAARRRGAGGRARLGARRPHRRAPGWHRRRVRGVVPLASATGRHRKVLGCEMTERQLRFGLERAYRTLAHLADGARPTHSLGGQGKQRPAEDGAATHDGVHVLPGLRRPGCRRRPVLRVLRRRAAPSGHRDRRPRCPRRCRHRAAMRVLRRCRDQPGRLLRAVRASSAAWPGPCGTRRGSRSWGDRQGPPPSPQRGRAGHRHRPGTRWYAGGRRGRLRRGYRPRRAPPTRRRPLPKQRPPR